MANKVVIACQSEKCVISLLFSTELIVNAIKSNKIIILGLINISFSL